MSGTDPYVLIQGPAWGDARFYGEWLLGAGKAQAYWREAYTDLDFKKKIDRICLIYIPDFGIAASIMVMKLREYRTTKTLNDLVTATLRKLVGAKSNANSSGISKPFNCSRTPPSEKTRQERSSPGPHRIAATRPSRWPG
jgi:hypothetical protein